MRNKTRLPMSTRRALAVTLLACGLTLLVLALYRIEHGSRIGAASAYNAEAVSAAGARPAQKAAPGDAERKQANGAPESIPNGEGPGGAGMDAGGDSGGLSASPGHKPQPGEVLYAKRPSDGEELGTLSIPAIGKQLPIIEGTDPDELAEGVGHFAKSVLPGEKDNAVLSGHRDTVFRQLGKVKVDDELIVKTAAGTFTYQVEKMRIVEKDDKTVIVPAKDATLTLTTCYPFRYIGDAPQRYIITAKLVDSEVSAA